MNINSTLFLCNNVDLDPNYNYTIDFDNIQAQEAYFDSKVANVLAHTDDYSYIRDNQTLKVYVNVDDIVNINYMFFNNGNKRYYAFILKKDYVSATCTAITFKIDVMQSFMFDYTIDESFIDREHQDRFKLVNNRYYEPIYNTQNENLDIGNEYNEYRSSIESTDLMLITTKEPLVSGDFTCVTNLIDTGVYQYLCLNPYNHSFCNIKWASGTIEKVLLSLPDNLEENPKVISIKFLGFKPKFYENGTDGVPTINMTQYAMTLSNYNDTYLINLGKVDNNILSTVLDIADENEAFYYNPDITLAKRQTCEPKLNVYPYSFKKLYIGGKSNIIKNEHIKFNYNTTNVRTFNLKLYSSLSANGTTNGYIVENDTNKLSNAVVGRPFDITLRTDAWQEYLQNNKASVNGGLAVSALGTIAGIGLGFITGGLGWAVAGASAISFGTQIANTMMKQQDIKENPDEIRGSTDDLGTLLQVKQFLGLGLNTITEDYKNRIFNYLYRYGYKANDFKKPNVRSRYYFNYIKTIGANIKTNISADYKNEIAEIFNNGITLWHYRSSETFKGVNNYDYENVEMNLIGGNNG